MSSELKCPVCLNIDTGTRCRHIPQDTFQCDVCGIYTTDLDLAIQTRSGAYETGYWELNKVQRTVLSHRIRSRHDMEMDRRNHQIGSSPDGRGDRQAPPDGGSFRVTKEILEHLRSEARSPTPAEQAEKAIRYIGDHVSARGESLGEIPDGFRAAIGASDYGLGLWVVEQLQTKGLVDVGSKSNRTRVSPPYSQAVWKRGDVRRQVL